MATNSGRSYGRLIASVQHVSLLVSVEATLHPVGFETSRNFWIASITICTMFPCFWLLFVLTLVMTPNVFFSRSL